MPAKRRKINPDTIYASDMPLTQKKFPDRRRSSRLRTTTTTPTLQKRQSTLTQADFEITRTPASSEVVSSDDEAQRSRKPKRKKRKSDQSSTLTQMVREGFPSSSKRARLSPSNFEVLDGSDVERAASPRRHLDDEDHFRVQYDGEHEEQIPAPSPLQKSPRMRSQRSSDNKNKGMRESPLLEVKDSYSNPDEESLRAHSPLRKPQFQTPKKVRFTEVPSSQTPQDARLSIQSSRKTPVAERSPLKDRSTNISPRKRSLRKQSPSPSKKSSKSRPSKIFDENDPAMSGMHRVVPNDVLSAEASEPAGMLEIPESSQPAIQKPRDSQARARRPGEQQLGRIDEDSQGDDATTAFSPASPLPKDDDSQVPDSPVQESPMRKPRRINTVQDSQPDDLDLMAIDPDATQSEAGSVFQENDEDGTWVDTGPNTYDPLAAALERDAARYNQTETQIIRPERVTASQYEDQDVLPTTSQQEVVIEDERERQGEQQDQAPNVVGPSSPELGEPIDPEGQEQAPDLQIETDITAPKFIDSEDPSGDFDSPVIQSSPPPLEVIPPKKANFPSLPVDNRANSILAPTAAVEESSSQPSSPPVPTSQVSTVVPTQLSLLQSTYREQSTKQKPSNNHHFVGETEPSEATLAPPSRTQLPPEPAPAPHDRISQTITAAPTQPIRFYHIDNDNDDEDDALPTLPHTKDKNVYEPLKPPAPSQPLSLRAPNHQAHDESAPSTLSSSPLPLPPWSSPSHRRYLTEMEQEEEEERTRNGGQAEQGWKRDKDGVYELDDFSLPPMPPVSSWSGSGRSEGVRSSPLEL